MKLLTIFFIFLHLCWSIPKDDNVNYEVKFDNEKITYESNLKNQNYAYRVVTSDGIIKYEKAHFEDNNLVVEGRYEFITNGLKYTVVYVADKNGYRPKVSFSSVGFTYPKPSVPFPVPSRPPPPSTGGYALTALTYQRPAATLPVAVTPPPPSYTVGYIRPRPPPQPQNIAQGYATPPPNSFDYKLTCTAAGGGENCPMKIYRKPPKPIPLFPRRPTKSRPAPKKFDNIKCTAIGGAEDCP